MFVAVSSDKVFAAFTGVVVGLLLLTIALLGHLLGFHIYLSKKTIIIINWYMYMQLNSFTYSIHTPAVVWFI